MQEFRRMSAYFHEMYAKFGSDRANRDTDSKMKKSIGSKMPRPEFGLQGFQEKLDPGEEYLSQTPKNCEKVGSQRGVFVTDSK